MLLLTQPHRKAAENSIFNYIRYNNHTNHDRLDSLCEKKAETTMTALITLGVIIILAILGLFVYAEKSGKDENKSAK